MNALGESRRIKSLRNPAVKMSKSDRDPLSRILLTDSADEIHQKLRKAVTDSTPHITFDPVNRPGVANLIEIVGAFNSWSPDEVCRAASHLDTLGFKNFVADVIIEQIKPIRERIIQLQNDPVGLSAILNLGNDQAASIANHTYNEVKHLVGFV